MPSGRHFWKLTGSGNDFVFFDARHRQDERLADPAFVATVCARGTGVGADGVVILEAAESADARMRYFNSDGSAAALCGNAALCTVRLLTTLGASHSAVAFESDAGLVRGRLVGGRPQIDLPAVTAAADQTGIASRDGEERIGFAVAGVPHLVVLVRDPSAVDVPRRGRDLRNHRSLAEGANVNFVGPAGADGRAIRTYERGVEGETLACGTGAVATAALLVRWGLDRSPVRLRTRSGQVLTVAIGASQASATSLAGEGRIVFTGELDESLAEPV
ncbi:MAG: diaminopimelate epimerase [Gemmatimonadaceae bacterium]